jgi:GNAT superfamily N-acetyltransferase
VTSYHEGAVLTVPVRPAVEADFPALVLIGRKFAEQTAYRKVPYSEAGAVSWFRLMMNQGLLYVSEDGGRITGVIGGVMSPFLINPDYGVGTELLMWVEPEHRGGGTADALMDAIERAAREAGLTFWSMMSLEAINPDRVAKIYERRGYELAEHTFLKEL